MPRRRRCPAARLFCATLVCFAALVPAFCVAAAPPVFAPTVDDLTRAAPQAMIEVLPGGFVLVTPPPFQPERQQDERYRWTLSRAAWIYGPGAAAGKNPAAGLVRVVTLHFAPEDEDAGARTARLCARLARLHRERFGRDLLFGRGSEEADVWLLRGTPESAGAQAGGETRGKDLYIFATSAPRTRLEWARTVCHEWGHLSLPAARGYHEPENDAAGFLGERLFLQWLRGDEEARAGQSGDDWTSAADLATYHARQIAPLIARWEREGPASRILAGRDAKAMDLYIGATLACDRALGSVVTGRALFSVLGTGAVDFLTALQTSVARGGGGAEALLTVRLPAWVPFVRATYEVRPPAPLGKARGTVVFSGRAPLVVRSGTPRGAPLQIREAGWKWVRTTAGNVSAIVLRRAAPAKPGARRS